MTASLQLSDWVLNTSNPGKAEEFSRIFSSYGIGIELQGDDLKEIDADPLTVIVQKASQREAVWVEDTSVDVEGKAIGVNVRWLLDEVFESRGLGAVWRVLFAYRHGDTVSVYRGAISGTIVEPRGQSDFFCLDTVFQPDGSQKTLAEWKPDHLNARAIAIDNAINDTVWQACPAIEEWHGPWQH